MSKKFSGFDPERVAALQRAVAAASEPARALSRAIGAVADTAAEVIARAAGMSTANLGIEASRDTDADRLGLRPIVVEAPDVADEIRRRLAHLAGCAQLQRDGYCIAPAAVFADDPPPAAAHVDDALRPLREALSSGDLDGAFAGLGDANRAIDGLTRAETEAFVGALSTSELGTWNVLLSLHSFGVGVSDDDRRALASNLFGRLSDESARTIADAVPALEPLA
jgi:hypothetical protein